MWVIRRGRWVAEPPPAPTCPECWGISRPPARTWTTRSETYFIFPPIVYSTVPVLFCFEVQCFKAILQMEKLTMVQPFYNRLIYLYCCVWIFLLMYCAFFTYPYRMCMIILIPWNLIRGSVRQCCETVMISRGSGSDLGKFRFRFRIRLRFRFRNRTIFSTVFNKRNLYKILPFQFSKQCIVSQKIGLLFLISTFIPFYFGSGSESGSGTVMQSGSGSAKAKSCVSCFSGSCSTSLLSVRRLKILNMVFLDRILYLQHEIDK